MQVRMYSIYDRVSEEYCFPVSAKNDATAARMFQGEMAKAPEHVREDYSLFFVGVWDSESGEISVGPFVPEKVNLVEAMAEVKEE